MSKINETIDSLLKINKEMSEIRKKIKQVELDIEWINSKGFDFIVVSKSKLNL